MNLPELQENPAKTITPCRGIIIVDASFLFQLISDIPNGKLKANGDRTKFLDLLPFLAKNGYHIVIPEMISYEAGQILASGSHISGYTRPCYPKYGSDVLKPFLKDAARIEGDKHKDNPNIGIRSETGPKDVDEFLRAMQRIIDEQLKGRKFLDKKVLDEANPTQTRKLIKENSLYKIEDTKNNFFASGDDAILSLLEKDFKKQNGKLVVVLTDDKELQNIINANYPHIGAITTTRFIYSLVNSGLGAAAGLPQFDSAYNIDLQRRADMRKLAGKKSAKNDSHLNEELYIRKTNLLPITKSFAKLSEDLNKEKIEGAATGDTGENRVAKFLDKYKIKPATAQGR